MKIAAGYIVGRDIFESKIYDVALGFLKLKRPSKTYSDSSSK